jgi:hypothetical protein
VASVTRDFIDATFIMVWGGFVCLSFHEVSYGIGASECILMFVFFNRLVILRICRL